MWTAEREHRLRVERQITTKLTLLFLEVITTGATATATLQISTRRLIVSNNRLLWILHTPNHMQDWRTVTFSRTVLGMATNRRMSTCNWRKLKCRRLYGSTRNCPRRLLRSE